MTLTNTTVKQRYNGNGATVNFAIPFAFQDTTEIKVYLRDETDPDNITQVLQTLSTDYTLTGGPPVTTVHMLSAPSASQKIEIIRSTTLKQQTDYIDDDSFPAESHENALDKLTQIVQELDEKFHRAVLLPLSSAITDVVTENEESYAYLRWNVGATALENSVFVATTPLVFDPATSTFSMPQASAVQDGYLDNVDWSVFNSKQPAGDYITALVGDVVATGPGAVPATIQSGVIIDSMISGTAGIAVTKLAGLTASRAVVSNLSGFIVASSVTSTELASLNGTGTASPTFVNESITGYFATQRRDESSSATLNSMSSAKSYVKLTATVGTINGIAAGADGQIIVVYNDTGSTVIISDQSASASAIDRIKTTDGNAITLATKTPQAFIYDSGQSRWVVWGGGGGSGSGGAVALVGTIDTQTPSANGATIASSTIYFQSASATDIGMVNTTTQSFAGTKTFTGAVCVNASNLTGALNVKSKSDALADCFNLQSADGTQSLNLVLRNSGDIFLYNGTHVLLAFAGTSGTLGGSGDVGPSFKWDINDSNSNTTVTTPAARVTMAITNNDTTANNMETIGFGNIHGLVSTITCVNTVHAVGASTGYLSFATKVAGTLAERVQINQTGIGYGVGTPGQSLDVSGNARIRGLSTAGPVSTDATGLLSSSTLAAFTVTLSNFVGDSGLGGTKGLVPAPASGDAAAGKFLKADGTWSAASTGLPTIFGSRASPRSIVPSTGISSAASHMSTSAASQDVYVQSNSATDALITANPQISNGTTDGQTIRVVGRSNSATVSMTDGNGLSLKGAVTLAADSVLTLRWDGTNWVEVSRSI